MEDINGNIMALPTQAKRWMNMQEVAVFLGVSRWTILRLVKQKEIPYIPYGRIKRFDRDAIEETLRQRTVKVRSNA